MAVHTSRESTHSNYTTIDNFIAAHVIEEAHEAKNGIEFLTTTRDDWKGSVFGCHITWHLTLYYFGKSV